MPQSLSLAQLKELASDPNVTPDDVALLTPQERAAFDRLKLREKGSSLFPAIRDFSTGMGKGAADTAIGLGNLVHQTPGVGHVTDALAKLLGPSGTNPETAFAGADAMMEPSNTAERAGKTTEQVGEFFIPGGAAARAIEGQGAKLASKAIGGYANASPTAVRTASNITRSLSQILGEGATATGVAAAHGDQTPEIAGKVAGGAAAGGEGLRYLTAALQRTPGGRQLLSYLAAIAAAGSMYQPTGLAGAAGTFGLARYGANKAVQNPELARLVEQLMQVGGRLGAGAVSEGR